MALRQYARQRALQLLYTLEFRGETFEAAKENFLRSSHRQRKAWDAFAEELARKTYEHRSELDAEIAKTLEHWKIERLTLTDRICLRMALCEFRDFPEIPLRVTIDEYIELARLFGDEESPQFVNGVLDRLARDFHHKDFQVLAGARRSKRQRKAPKESRPGAMVERTLHPPVEEHPLVKENA